MNYDKLKEQISDLQSGAKNKTGTLLKSINSLVNDKATTDLGRDLVIRLLAKISVFSQNEQAFIFSLVRTVGLFPYISSRAECLDELDRLAFEAHRVPGVNENLVFHSLQAKVYNLINAGHNVILSAATSVGKSLVIDAIIAAGRFHKIVIVVPTIALIDETRRRLTKKFSFTHTLITHPSQLESGEKSNIYILTQERVLQRGDLGDTDFFVIDEFYKLDLSSDKDLNRAIDLNLAFHKLSTGNAQFYLIGPNINAIRGLDKHEFIFVPSTFTTVAVDFIPFNLATRGDARQNKLVELAKNIDSPTIIYCQSPASANHVANILIDRVATAASESTADVADWIAKNYHEEWDVCRAIRYGIAIHHGGVPRALQQYFIKLFNEKRIRYLVCTSTIIEGVNTSAENVIIYDRRKGGNSVFDFFTYKNISGRAGRMGHYFVGKVYMLEEAPKDENFTVDFAIGQQGEATPLGLLMELDQESLSEESKTRLDQIYRGSLLSKETLIANRQTPLADQFNIAEELLSDIRHYHKFLSWKAIPTGPELEAVCQLIFNHLLEGTLRDYNIHSGASLAFHINSLRMEKNLHSYISNNISDKREDQSISQAVNNTLRFIRNIVSYRLPRELMAISRIQNEVFRSCGLASGDYTLLATQMESLFSDHLLYALDEYGIPSQISERLSRDLLPAENLNEILKKLKRLSLSKYNLSKFEIHLAQSAIDDL